MLLGAHVSIAGGVQNAPANGVRIGCDVIQIFSKNQRQWIAKPYTPEDIDSYRTRYAQSGLRGAVVHGSYLINLASADDALWTKSKDAFLDEARRCDQLGIADLVFHPGSHLGNGVGYATKRIAAALDSTLAQLPERTVHLDLECMAGQGTNVGHQLEDLARILELVGEKKRLGVCLDTCHLFAAGYDISNPKGYAETMRLVDRTVGLARVRAFHLNDSKGPLDCRVDRHENIGAGHIGKTGFSLLMNDDRFENVPMNLETPGEDEGYIRDLKVLRGFLGRKVPSSRAA